MDGLTLAIIAKDEEDQLKRIAKDYGQYFDEIVVAWDNEKLPDVEGIRVVPYKWQNNFAHKRNFLADHINTKYYFRMDTDDILIRPENIKHIYEKAVKSDADCVYVPYIYARDEDGNCIAKHWRETLIKKREGLYWKKPVHENIFIEDQESFKGAKDETVQILHMDQEGHAEKSSMRNVEILLEEFNRDKEATDPRTIAYIGRMLMGVCQWERAIKFLEILIDKSGWDDDKYFAYTELGFCHLQVGNYKSATSACLEAIAINPDYPDANICMGEVYINQRDFNKAKTWLLQANIKKTPDTMYVMDPSKYTVRLAIDLSAAYFGLGEFDNAYKMFKKAESMAPNNLWIKENKNLFNDGYEQDKYMKNFMWLYKYIEEKDKDRLQEFVKSVPKNMIEDERIQALRHKVLPGKKWDKGTVVIYCWKTLAEWAAPSVLTGLGGSEEAVVYMSKELTKLGYKVTVYCNCGDLKGTYEGVEYKEFFEFNPKDNFDILISWRMNIFFGQVKARRKICWFHDVFSKQNLDLWFSDKTDVDKMIVLSEAHKDLVPESFDKEKIFVSKNGIYMPDFMKNGVLRNPHRMIYTSSYDRGIQHLLQMWPDIKQEVPEAELHLFYGWNTYDDFVKIGGRSQKFKDAMVELMKQDGVFEHGRVGHKQLVKELQKSKFFVYPSHFYEISCISAMKAQACGCVPVVTDYAALKETVKDGIKVPGSAEDPEVKAKYRDALIKALKEQPEIKVDKEQFSWESVAKQWHEELFV